MKTLLLALLIAAIAIAQEADSPFAVNSNLTFSTSAMDIGPIVSGPFRVIAMKNGLTLLSAADAEEFEACLLAIAAEHHAVLKHASRADLSRAAQHVEDHCEFPQPPEGTKR